MFFQLRQERHIPAEGRRATAKYAKYVNGGFSRGSRGSRLEMGGHGSCRSYGADYFVGCRFYKAAPTGAKLETIIFDSS
jgi:hypothetical protein